MVYNEDYLWQYYTEMCITLHFKTNKIGLGSILFGFGPGPSYIGYTSLLKQSVFAQSTAP